MASRKSVFGLIVAASFVASPLYATGQGAFDNEQKVDFSCDFENATWWRAWGMREPPPTAITVCEDPDRSYEPVSGCALRILIAQGTHSGLSIHYKFRRPLRSEPEEGYLAYRIRLSDDWNPVAAGKLPGFSGTYGTAGWGGRPSHGFDGWSARGLFQPSVNDHTPVGFYVYHMDADGRYGSAWVWDKHGFPGLQKNRWYVIEQYVKLNTPAKADGILRAWVDGTLVFEKTDIRMRSVPELKIESVWVDVYHGGSVAAREDHHLYIDDVVVARERVDLRGETR